VGAGLRQITNQAFVLGFCLVAAAGCAGGSPTDVDSPPPDVSVASPPYLHHSLHSGFNDEVRIVIRDAATWQAFWRQLIQRGAQAPEQPPAVDFTVHVVVVAATGARERAGYHIAIPAYHRAAGKTQVTILKTAPPADCPSSPVISTPIAVTAVAIAASVSFLELEESTTCPD
jgi:hypothetical protein